LPVDHPDTRVTAVRRVEGSSLQIDRVKGAHNALPFASSALLSGTARSVYDGGFNWLKPQTFAVRNIFVLLQSE
jgi:hypothetical protein